MNKELLNGRNALHYAADYGQVEVIKLLLNKGADVNVSVHWTYAYICVYCVCLVGVGVRMCVCVCVCVCVCTVYTVCTCSHMQYMQYNTLMTSSLHMYIHTYNYTIFLSTCVFACG